MKPRPPLGECLQRQGALDAPALAAALARQSQGDGGRLGEHLLYTGHIDHRQLASALALHLGHERAGETAGLSPMAGREDDLAHYLHLGLLPIGRREGRPVVAATDPGARTQAFIRNRFGSRVEMQMMTRREWRQQIEHDFHPALMSHAKESLWQRLPRYSARRQDQDSRMLAGLLLLAAFAAVSPALPGLRSVVLIAACLFFLVSLALRLSLMFLTPKMEAQAEPYTGDWPVYTVLVPLYREAAMLPRILSAIDALDYPKRCLDVKLIFEEDDLETFEAACAARPPAYVEMLRVPASILRTKPQACNYALQFARGRFVTIYDAEDRPEPQQLKKAVRAFAALPPEVACLQARLDYDNREETWLTRLFAIEYALLFTRLIPGLYRAGIPIPLGGTSNHLRTHALRWVGAWDPYNVTEDADLGLRLFAAGYRTAPLDSVTLEEAPLTLTPWLKQRGRWIKGYLITWTVHTRNPLALKRHIGLMALAGLQLFIGGASVVYLIAPILWLQTAWGWLLPGQPWIPSDAAGRLCLLTCACGMGVQWISAALVVRQEGWRGMAPSVALFPLYWMLHSAAAARAVWQLFTDPYRWDKTEHGRSRLSAQRAACALTSAALADTKARLNA